MRNCLVLLAGGVGSRMHAELPKQFIEVDGVPIIGYTLRAFERNEKVTDILIVCHPDYRQKMADIVKDLSLTKVQQIVDGGATGHDSARNGVFALEGMNPEDLVIVHDAARPILPQRIIDDMIATANEYGNACSSIPMNETIVITDDQRSGVSEVERARVRRVQTPQAYRYDLIHSLYEKAEADGIHNFVYANTMALHYGVRLYFSQGFGNNIKITNPEDLALFKALSSLDEDELR